MQELQLLQKQVQGNSVAQNEVAHVFQHYATKNVYNREDIYFFFSKCVIPRPS